MSDFRIVSPFAPTVVRGLDGKRYAIAIGSPWIEIPEDMTTQQVHAGWVRPERKATPVAPKRRTVTKRRLTGR